MVFNRFKPDMDKMAFHKVVRGASSGRGHRLRGPQAARFSYDDIEDPCPSTSTHPS